MLVALIIDHMRPPWWVLAIEHLPDVLRKRYKALWIVLTLVGGVTVNLITNILSNSVKSDDPSPTFQSPGGELPSPVEPDYSNVAPPKIPAPEPIICTAQAITQTGFSFSISSQVFSACLAEGSSCRSAMNTLCKFTLPMGETMPLEDCIRNIREKLPKEDLRQARQLIRDKIDRCGKELDLWY